MLQPPCPFPRAWQLCPPGASGHENSTPGGCQAQLPGIASPRGAQNGPLGGDRSGHSSNLELFCPYQLVAAGLPDTCSQGRALSGGFPGRERAATVQHGYLPATEKGRLHLGTFLPTEDLAPPLLLQASNSSFFPVPYTRSVAQSPRYADLMCTHPCPVSPTCDPFSCPTPVPLHKSRTG